MLEEIEIKVPIQREDPTAPRYVVVPSKLIAVWELERTTEVDVEVNGKPGGRRRLRRWDEARWYIQLPQRVCEELRVDTGSVVNVSIRLAVHDLPGELVLVLGGHPEARARWDGLTAAEQHRIRVDVGTAQLPTTRWQRAATALEADAPVPDHIVRESQKLERGGREPLRVELHAPPDTPESRKALDEALDSAANLFAGMILYESWKETTIATGGDPADRKLVPDRLLAWWEGEYDKESREKRKGGPKPREKL